MTIKILITLAALFITACRPNRYIQAILKDEAKRGKMYHEILKNENYRVQLLDSLRHNQNTKTLINTPIKADINSTEKKKE